jgi:hypothetical protein
LQRSRGSVVEVAAGQYSVIGGGRSNTSAASNSTIGGGNNNSAGTLNSTIGGGQNNSIQINGGQDSTIGGGQSNSITAPSSSSIEGVYSVICGGNSNTTNGLSCVIGGGISNSILGSFLISSVIFGGSNNSITSSYSTICGGISNTTNGQHSIVLGGNQGKTTRYGEASHSAGQFAAGGDAQHTILIARNSTVNASGTVLLLDGSSARLTIPPETTWIFTTKLSAYNDTDNLRAGYNIRGCIGRNAAPSGTSIIGSNIVESWAEGAMSGCVATVTADTTNEALQINVNGLASKNIRWVAVVDISQVSYGTP